MNRTYVGRVAVGVVVLTGLVVWAALAPQPSVRHPQMYYAQRAAGSPMSVREFGQPGHDAMSQG